MGPSWGFPWMMEVVFGGTGCSLFVAPSAFPQSCAGLGFLIAFGALRNRGSSLC